MNDWLLNENLHFSDDFNRISFDEMRSFDENFLRNLFDQLLIMRNNHLFYNFLVFLDDDRLISVFNKFNSSNFRHFDFNRYFPFNVNNFSSFNNVRDALLNFHIFSLLDDLRNSHLDLLDGLSSFI